MQQLIPVPLGPNSVVAKGNQASGATLTNCHAEPVAGGKVPFIINPDPGLRLICDVGVALPTRGFTTLKNKLYAVVGERLYRIYQTGLFTDLGAIPGTYNVIFSANRKQPNEQITITADATNHILENDVLSLVSDVDLPSGVHSSTYINGYTVYGRRDGSFYWSGINNSGSIGGLDFAEAERQADGSVRVFTVGEELWVFGVESLEVFRTTGLAGASAFAPITGTGKGQGAGCSLPHSVQYLDGAVYWVNDTGTVVKASTYQPQRISNHDVDRDISTAIKAGHSDRVMSSSIDFEGHQFYILRAPDWCWCFNVATGLWHRKRSYDSQTWRGYHGVFSSGDYYFSDSESGKFYVSDFASDDAGNPHVMEVISGNVNDAPGGLICDALMVDMQSGVGNAEAVSSNIVDPTLSLRVSYDGGMTWGNSYIEKVGQQGDWKRRIRFNRLGKTNGHGMKFMLTAAAPVARNLFQAHALVRGAKL